MRLILIGLLFGAPLIFARRPYFLLYTNTNPEHPQLLITDNSSSIADSNFNAEDPIRIFIHGFQNDRDSPCASSIKNAYLDAGEFNVIVVDWSHKTSVDYTKATFATNEVGEETAEFIRFLAQLTGIALSEIVLVGFSLGAHAAGSVGKALSPQKVGVIVGLDPPKLGYDLPYEEWKRLGKEDAEYVQVIHTEVSLIGMRRPLGHADFYPNYGVEQPTCRKLELSCSHSRAHEMFAESITSPDGYMGLRCHDHRQIKRKKCLVVGNQVYHKMGGEPVDTTAKGEFYVKVSQYD